MSSSAVASGAPLVKCQLLTEALHEIDNVCGFEPPRAYDASSSMFLGDLPIGNIAGIVCLKRTRMYGGVGGEEL